MSAVDFQNFYQTIGGIIAGAWNCIQGLTIAGIGLGTWFLGFALLGVLVKVFHRITSVDSSGGASKDE